MEAFREHLEHPVGRGMIDGSVGVAGGSLCGDVATIAVRVEDGRVRVGWEASGCGATRPRAPRPSPWRPRTCSTPPASRRRPSPPSSAGCPRASCTPPTSPPTRCTRRSARPPGGGAAGRAPARVAVAMSGGVDSAVAALLVGEARVRRDARALARPRQRRRGVVLLGVRRPRGARRRPRPRACRTSRSTCATEFRAGRRRPLAGRPRGGADPQPVRALQRPRAPRRDGRLRRPARRAPPGHGPLRAVAGRAAARRRRPGEGPGLHARRDRAGDARAAALPARRADQAAGARARRRGGLAVASKAESQDLCFLAGTGRAAFLAKHGRREAPGDLVDAAASGSAATTASTTSPSASARASASPPRSRCTCCPKDGQHRHRRPARAARDDARWRSATLVLHRPAAEVEPSAALPRAALPLPPRRRRCVRARRAGPRRRPRPGRRPVLRGDAVVGLGDHRQLSCGCAARPPRPRARAACLRWRQATKPTIATRRPRRGAERRPGATTSSKAWPA